MKQKRALLGSNLRKDNRADGASMTHSCPDCAKVGAGLLQSLNAGAMLKKSRGLGQSPSSNSVVPMFTTPLSLFRAPYHPYAPALPTSPAALKLPTRTLVRPLTNGGESPPVPPFREKGGMRPLMRAPSVERVSTNYARSYRLIPARRGKTREGLSRSRLYSGQAPRVLRRSSKSSSSRVFSRSKHSAPTI